MNDYGHIANIFQRIANLSPERLKLLELLILQDKQQIVSKRNVVVDYYNSLSNFSTNKFLNFAPFPEIVPKFSWILTASYPEKYQEHARLVLSAQKEMRDVSLRKVDFYSCKKVFDFGCGYGSDLIDFAQKYDHLELCGYTISDRQADIAAKKVHEHNLQERIKIFNRDSSKDEFPSQYDLVIGFEVACHIKNKKALFSNVGKHLTNSGLLVLADFISNAAFTLEDDQTSSYMNTKEEWVELLSQNHLKVINGIDVTKEMANYFYDPEFKINLESVYKINHDNDIKAAVQSYEFLSKLFRKGLASYVLLTAQKQTHLSKDEIYQLNQESLSALVSYSDILLKKWLYELEWQPKARTQPEPTLDQSQAVQPGSWLIFTDSGGVGQGLAELLEDRGDRCVMIFIGEAYEILKAGHWKINPKNPEDFQRLFQEALETSKLPFKGIVHLWSLEAATSDQMTIASLEQAQTLGCGSVLHLMQTLVKTKKTASPKLWLVTRGAMPAGANPVPLAVAQAPLWGMGKVIALEHPQLWGGMLDLAPEAASDEAATLLAEIGDSQGEDHLAFREGQRYVARLVRSRPLQPQGLPFRSDGTYLITGGLGALGIKVAQWMVEQGVRHLVLTGRRGVSSQTQATITSMEQMGTEVLVAQADVSSQGDMVRVLEEVKASMPPLRGVVHAAGVPGYQALEDMELNTLESVLRPKVVGTWILHQLTQEMKLDFFVCFSSIASVWGSKGQAHYAAANHFLDVLAHYRQGLGLQALSVNWGPWAGGGMASPEAQTWLTRMGVEELPLEQAIANLGYLLGVGCVQTTVANVDWTLFKALYEARKQRPLLEQILALPREPAKQESVQAREILQRLSEAPTSDSPAKTLRDRHSLLSAYIQEQVAKALGLSASQLDVQEPLNNMGLDSLMAVELRNRVKTELGVDVPIVKFMEGLSVASLATQVSEQLTDAQSSSHVSFVTKNPLSLGERKATQIGMNKRVHPEDSGRLSRRAISDSDWTEGEL